MQHPITHIAAMIADQARANMLLALLSGRALTASELAIEADITAQTASSHLAKMLQHNLLQVQKQGRHKYFQLHNPEIARLLETLLVISETSISNKVKTGPACPSLRQARVCYDHIAGKVGVEIFDGLLQQNILELHQQAAALTPTGKAFFIQLGADIEQLEKKRRPLCRACLDWSERRSHLAGSVGQWVLEFVLTKKWAKRDLDSRALHFSDSGYKKLRKLFNFSP